MNVRTEPSAQRSGRFAYLDGLRGWAALLVVIHHGSITLSFALYSGKPEDARGAWDIWLSGTPLFPVGAGGSFAVCTFFALSGFVLAHAYSRSKQGWLALVCRRYVRLGVPMLSGCLLGWLLLAAGLMRADAASDITRSWWLATQFHQQPSLGAALWEPVRLLAGISSKLSTSYDSSLWTMPIEAGASVALITLFVGLRLVGPHMRRWTGYLLLAYSLVWCGSYSSLFAFGAAVQQLQPQALFIAIGKRRWLMTLLGLSAFFLGTVPFAAERWGIYDLLAGLSRPLVEYMRPWRHDPVSLWHGAGAALLLVVTLSSPGLQMLLARPVSQFLGRISFPLYVFHVPLLMVVECNAIVFAYRLGLPPLIGELGSLALYVVAALAAAAALCPLVEEGAITLSARTGIAVDKAVRNLISRLRRSAPASRQLAAGLAAKRK
jgi:peptidoglycan/LPS O-acetylase OafA/YrhL